MFKVLIVRTRNESRSELVAPRRRAGFATGAAIVALAAVLSCVPGATAEVTNPLDVQANYFVQPPKSYSATIYDRKYYTLQVRAGSTTVPTTATAVLINVTDKSGKAGVIDVQPYGQSGYPGQLTTKSWAAGENPSGYFMVAVGASDKISIYNRSGRTLSLGIQIVGYSDKVPVGQISGSTAQVGDVLRTDGDGRVFWGPETTKLQTRSVTRTDTLTTRDFYGVAPCNSDEYPVAGGYSISEDSPPAQVRWSQAKDNAWTVLVQFSTPYGPRTVTTYATCALK